MLPDFRLFVAALLATVAFVFVGFSLMAIMRSAQVTSVMTPAPRAPIVEASGQAAASRVERIPAGTAAGSARDSNDIHTGPTTLAQEPAAGVTADPAITPRGPIDAAASRPSASINALIEASETTGSIGTPAERLKREDATPPSAEAEAKKQARRPRARVAKRQRSRPRAIAQPKYDSGPFSGFFQPNQIPTR